MKNFLRALRFAWPYRFRLTLSLFCALAAALFWSVTFTAIDPTLKILRHEKGLQEITNDEIKRIQVERIEPAKLKVNAAAKELERGKLLADGPDKDKFLRQNAAELAR